MKKPHVFIASSTEGLNIAKSIQENLDHQVFVTIWSQSFFELSKSSIDSLLSKIGDYDFSIFIFSSDDILTMRGKEKAAVRDNVIFEFGLFVGRLGIERCFIVQPRDEDIHMPTDFIGLTTATYNKHHPNLTAGLGAACSQIEKRISDLGFFNSKDRIGDISGENNDSLFTLDGEVAIQNIMGKLIFSPESWSVLDIKSNPAAEYQFLHTSGHGHAMIISEKLKCSLDTIIKVTIKHFHAGGYRPDILYRKKVDIKGSDAAEVGLDVVIEGMTLSYTNLYVCTAHGTLQLLMWCPTELKSDFEEIFGELARGLRTTS